MRGTYDNLYNRTRTRIDARNQADPAVQAGMRKIHRGMDGTVIGGVTAEGQGVGSRAGKHFESVDSPSAAALPAPTPAPAAPVPAGRPNALGGGLARWDRLNPNAKPAFGAGSPANHASTNRKLAAPVVAKPAGGSLASRFATAAMPKPAVPSMVTDKLFRNPEAPNIRYAGDARSMGAGRLARRTMGSLGAS